jgi:hypothetical protein
MTSAVPVTILNMLMTSDFSKWNSVPVSSLKEKQVIRRDVRIDREGDEINRR